MATNYKHRVMVAAASAALAAVGVGAPAAAAVGPQVAAPRAQTATQISRVTETCYSEGYYDGLLDAAGDLPWNPHPPYECDNQYYGGYIDGYNEGSD